MGGISELDEFVRSLSDSEKGELDELIATELKALWLPEPENEPQCAAFYSQADLLLFGGSAGGGKTDLLVGTALTNHQRAVIFRSKAVDLRGIEERILELAGRDGWNGADKIMRRPGMLLELGHLEKPGAELSHQGRPRDFYGFDEGAQLARKKVQFVIGWLRSTTPGQRRRIIIASNPPTGGEGEWLIEWFAPWLDDKFANPAKPGELRWAATFPDREGSTLWLPDGRPIVFLGERKYRYATDEEIVLADEGKRDDVVTPLTRTFIPSKLADNPYLAKTGYRAQLQALPEPLRSILLKGDFLAARVDHQWQVIPSTWVKAAQARWTPTPPSNAAMTALAADVAQGGQDDTVIAPRHGPWYAELIKKPGVETPKPSDVAGLVVTIRRNGAVVVVDMGGGYGGGVKERLEENNIQVRPFLGSEGTDELTADKQLKFRNMRSQAIWRFREALDPDQYGGSKIALPPDQELFADLTAYRWKLTTGGILIEDKEELKKAERLGRSPGKGDAVIMAWSEGEKAIVAMQRKARRTPPSTPRSNGSPDGTGWMAH